MSTLRITLVSAFAAALLFVGHMPAQLASDGVSQILSPSIAAAQEAPKPDIDVKIDVDRGGGRVWYTDPTMLLIGGGVLVLLIVLIAFASRSGGGTTIIREK